MDWKEWLRNMMLMKNCNMGDFNMNNEVLIQSLQISEI